MEAKLSAPTVAVRKFNSTKLDSNTLFFLQKLAVAMPKLDLQRSPIGAPCIAF